MIIVLFSALPRIQKQKQKNIDEFVGIIRLGILSAQALIIYE